VEELEMGFQSTNAGMVVVQMGSDRGR